jgi:hypothetical protein
MKRLVATTLLLAALAALLPSPAVAGGNFLEFRLRDAAPGSDPSRWDIFATGQTVVARVGYLSAAFGPTDGPFHLWIERGDELEAGSPIPESAIRVGTFRMAASGRGGQATFTMPELPRGTYTFSVCDDPCRTWGFDEWVQGWLTAVPTAGEAQLLARTRELRETLREVTYGIGRDVRAAEQREDRLTAEITALTGELDDARTELDRLRSAANGVEPRPVIDAAAGALIATGPVIVATLWLIGRRRSRIVVPDTPAELLASGTGTQTPPSERVLEDLDV